MLRSPPLRIASLRSSVSVVRHDLCPCVVSRIENLVIGYRTSTIIYRQRFRVRIALYLEKKYRKGIGDIFCHKIFDSNAETNRPNAKNNHTPLLQTI